MFLLSRYNLVPPSRIITLTLSLLLVSFAGTTLLAQSSNEFNEEDFPNYVSPYRLTHRGLVGVSFDALKESGRGASNFFEGTSFGISTEYYLISFFAVGLRYDRYYFVESNSSRSNFVVNSFLMTYRITPASGASYSPFLSLGLGVSHAGTVPMETFQAGVGFQFRPAAKTWARIEATTVSIGAFPRSEIVTVDRIDNTIQVGSYGIRLEFGFVY